MWATNMSGSRRVFAIRAAPWTPPKRTAASSPAFSRPSWVNCFFFLTLYVQNVLGWSPFRAGSGYLPVTVGLALSAGLSSQLIGRIGTRPLIVAGELIAAGGMIYLSRIPVDGSYPSDVLPGLLIMSVGLGMASPSHAPEALEDFGSHITRSPRVIPSSG